MAKLQVKSIDDKLYNCFDNKAKKENRSIIQEAIESLSKVHFSKSTIKDDPLVATARFLEMCRTWKDDRSSGKIIMDIKNSRKSKNRFK